VTKQANYVRGQSVSRDRGDRAVTIPAFRAWAKGQSMERCLVCSRCRYVVMHPQWVCPGCGGSEWQRWDEAEMKGAA
jgi:rubrerythrin